MDLKYLNTVDKRKLVVLSMVDAGTAYHVAVLLKNRRPRHVCRMIMKHWVAHYGVPDLIVSDQGSEFKEYFNTFCDEHGIDSRLTGTGASWQHGIAERHGATLGEMWRKLSYAHHTKRRKDAEMLLACICQAKNSTITRNGITAEQAVFGRSLKFTESANRDDDEVLMGVLSHDGVAWKAQQIRTAAKMMLLQRDAMEKVRRAMLHQAPPVIADLMPGTRVYFWSKNPLKGRHRSDPGRWRGPGTVVAPESDSRYYVSWRGRVLLLPRPT